MKPFTHALALGFYFRVPTEGSCKRLFCFLRDPQGGLANGPMSGPHPYTDCASMMTPAQWRSVATTKTGERKLILSKTLLNRVPDSSNTVFCK